MTDSAPLLRIPSSGSACLGGVALLMAILTLTFSAFLGLLCADALAAGRSIPTPGTVALGIALPLGVACAWISRRHHRTTVTIDLREDAIEVWSVSHLFRIRTVSWSDVRSFDDGADEFVTLVTKGGRLDLPTLTEEMRVALLALLDAKGVRRRD